MRSHRLVVLAVAPLALGLGLAGCSSDDAGDSSTSSQEAASEATSTPASTAPPTAPVADPVAAVETCLDGADLTTDPESDPRFGSLAELQVDATGDLGYVGVFVYATPEDAQAHVKALTRAGASGTEVLGTVVLAGTQDAPAKAAKAVAAIQACASATVE
jgi:hypothetical protein